MKFDNELYSIETIKKSLYKFADLAGYEITQNEKSIEVTIFNAKISSQEVQDLENSIRNEVIDQDLREIVANETKDVRRLILANAFSNTELLSS